MLSVEMLVYVIQSDHPPTLDTSVLLLLLLLLFVQVN
jgi:hypothetical protein